MSHVKSTTRMTRDPPRDAIGSGALRDTFEYVQTPLIDLVGTSDTREFHGCAFANCLMVWRPDWVIDPPNTFRLHPSVLESVNFFGHFSFQPDGKLIVVGRPQDPAWDVRPALASVQALISSARVSFLTPAEEGGLGSHGLPSRASVVAMPSPWRQISERPIPLALVGGRIVAALSRSFANVAGAQATGPAPTNPLTTPPRFVPGDRDASRAVFSGSEQAVYMVGGHRADGSRTGEIWRYDLSTDLWTHLFLGEDVGEVPRDIRAIAYDHDTGRILVIDTAFAPRLGRDRNGGNDTDAREHDGHGRSGHQNAGGWGPRMDRLLIIDTAAKKIRVAASFHHNDKPGPIGLAYTGDGRFVLVRAHDQTSFEAFAFRLGSSGELEWLGERREAGTMLDDPFVTPVGVLLPVAHHGVHDIVSVHTDPCHDRPSEL
jgi:hypothetical protein